jgi:adenosylmethionine-8-amino-7-oxononanoate aminotransferase
LASLDILERERLVERAEMLGVRFQQILRAEVGSHPLVAEVRGLGMIAGVQLVADVGLRLHNLLLAERLLCRPLGNTIGLSPPLIVTEEQLVEIAARLHRGLDRLHSQLRG